MLTALVLSGLANASDIGTDRMFGLGAEFGNGTYINVSGKYWFNEKSGLSFHGGTSFYYHEIGARFESNFIKGEWFDWADLPIWWWVGADVGVGTSWGLVAPQVGPSGGAGAALQFNNFPGEAFVTVGLGVYPLSWCNSISPYSTFNAGCWIQGRGTLGFRYYF